MQWAFALADILEKDDVDTLSLKRHIDEPPASWAKQDSSRGDAWTGGIMVRFACFLRQT